MKRFSLALFLTFLLVSFNELHADNSDEVTIGEWNFSLGMGYGQAENPIGGIDDLNLYLLPNVSYYGEKFFLENTTLGYSLFEDDTLIIDLVGRLNDDGLYFQFEDFGILTATGLDGRRGWDLFGIDDIERDISYLGGIAANYSAHWFDISAGYYHDISKVHHGYEVDLKLSRNFQFQNWSLQLESGANYKSEDLLNYYYKLEENESIIFVGLYTPDSSGINYHFKMSAEKQINQDWSWFASFKRTFLSDEIKNNPFIDTSAIDLFFIGAKYNF